MHAAPRDRRAHPAPAARASTPSPPRCATRTRRWDGRGYPDGLAGEAIPLASRIVLACDAWHALVSDRPYRKALPVAEARAELERCAGTQFDPRVVGALLACSPRPTPPRREHARGPRARRRPGDSSSA